MVAAKDALDVGLEVANVLEVRTTAGSLGSVPIRGNERRPAAIGVALERTAARMDAARRVRHGTTDDVTSSGTLEEKKELNSTPALLRVLDTRLPWNGRCPIHGRHDEKGSTFSISDESKSADSTEHDEIVKREGASVSEKSSETEWPEES